jgi:hypothetical protein
MGLYPFDMRRTQERSSLGQVWRTSAFEEQVVKGEPANKTKVNSPRRRTDSIWV